MKTKEQILEELYEKHNEKEYSKDLIFEAMDEYIKNADINLSSIKNIAFYLEGLKDGKGDILPLGIFDLEQLWKAIKFLQS